MEKISMSVEIVYIEKREEKVKKYRIEDDFYRKVESLMRNEIDNISEIYNLENVISIKFTG